MRTVRKGLNEEIREGFDWADRLIRDDNIASSSWEADSGIDIANAEFDDLSSDIDIAGGSLNVTYRLTNLVTTDKGLDYERSFKVMVVER